MNELRRIAAAERPSHETRMFGNVIVGVDDYAHGRHALELAKALVSRDGRITLIYVEVVQTSPAPELDASSVAERQRFGLERLGRLADEAQITAEVARVQAPSVRNGLHEFAASRAADLIMIGVSSRNAVARLQLGDDVREVLVDPPCAVAVAPNGYSGGSAQMRKIGVAYDGSPQSERALAVAREIAAEHHAGLLAYEMVFAPTYAPDGRHMGEIDEQVNKSRQRLASFGDVEPHVEAGDDPAEGIRRFGASVDLLVLGSHTYRPPERVLRRSTSQRVADGTTSPLLVLASER